MSFTLADAVVYFRGDQSQLDKDTEGAKGKVSSFISSAGGMLATGLVAGAAAAGAAVLGIGAAALGMESEFDDAIDAIINATGASGAALEEMGESVRNLKTSAAGLGVSMEDIGSVLGEVNTRTGLTGEALEQMTGQVLEFSRLAGGDAVSNTQKLTRVMGDWGVETENAGDLLDMLYGAGQAFGIGFDDLAGKVVAFGAPLRQMGFSLEESVALFGKWEKEGVNAELAIGSLRIAAGKFANEGVDLAQGLKDVQERIKGAATESDALSIAMETFGARAGPDMAAAIREGRFELDSAIEALRGTSGGLADAAERTLGFREKWEIEMAKVKDALIPLGGKLAELAERMMPAVTKAVETLMPWIEGLIDGLIRLIDWFAGTTEKGDETGGMLEKATGWASTAVEAFNSIVSFLRDTFWGTFDTTGGKFDFVKQKVDEIMPYIQQVVETVLGAIQGFWETNGETIQGVVSNMFQIVETTFTTALSVILDAVKLFFQVLTGDWEGAGETLKNIARTLWDGITEIFRLQLNSIGQILFGFDLGDAGGALLGSLRRGIENKWNDLKDWFKRKIQSLRDMLPFSEPKDPTSPLRNLDRAGVGLVEQVQKGLDKASFSSGFLRPLAGAAAGATGGMGPISLVQNFYGPAEPEAVRQASEKGIRSAFRQRGMA